MSPPPLVMKLILSPLLGTFVTMMLYGATCMQTYQYFDNYGSEDSTAMKSLVAFIFILETVASALSAYHVEFYLIEHFGDAEKTTEIHWSILVSVTIGFVIAWAVNQFFTRRIYILSKKNLWLSIVISILATVRPAFGFAAVGLAFLHARWTIFRIHAQWVMVTGLTIGLVVDGLITFCVSWQLLKGRKTINHSTRNIINSLLMYCINTGAVLTFFAIIELFGLLAFNRTLVFLGLFQVQIQLYANCFLTNLNARQSLRRDNKPTVITMSGERSNPQRSPAIEIKTETFIAVDGDDVDSDLTLDKGPHSV